jgi:hypothetical protein
MHFFLLVCNLIFLSNNLLTVLTFVTGPFNLLIIPFFKAPELHVEIHKHGLGQQSAGAAGPSSSSGTKV